MNTRRITRIAMFIALLVIGSQVVIPLGVVPLTLQTFVVYLIAYLLDPKDAFITVLIYMFMGLMGLPVFAGWGGGPHSIASPSFGFIIGFSIATTVGSILIRTNTDNALWKHLIVGVVTSTVLNIFGLAYMYGYFNIYLKAGESIGQILAWGFTPFIIGDAVKIFAASIIAHRLRKIPSFKL